MRKIKCQQCKNDFMEDDGNPNIHYSEPAKICDHCESKNSKCYQNENNHYKQKESNTLSEWIEECPCPILARVISDVKDLEYLQTTTHIYDENTLVLVPIKTLKELENINNANN